MKINNDALIKGLTYAKKLRQEGFRAFLHTYAIVQYILKDLYRYGYYKNGRLDTLFQVLAETKIWLKEVIA